MNSIERRLTVSSGQEAMKHSLNNVHLSLNDIILITLTSLEKKKDDI